MGGSSAACSAPWLEKCRATAERVGGKGRRQGRWQGRRQRSAATVGGTVGGNGRRQRSAATVGGTVRGNGRRQGSAASKAPDPSTALTMKSMLAGRTAVRSSPLGSLPAIAEGRIWNGPRGAAGGAATQVHAGSGYIRLLVHTASKEGRVPRDDCDAGIGASEGGWARDLERMLVPPHHDTAVATCLLGGKGPRPWRVDDGNFPSRP